MKKFTFTVTTETTECYTIYWRIASLGPERPGDYDSGERSKDFMTEDEARKFAENLKHDDKLISDPICEYRRIIDISKPKITYRSPPPENTTFQKI